VSIDIAAAIVGMHRGRDHDELRTWLDSRTTPVHGPHRQVAFRHAGPRWLIPLSACLWLAFAGSGLAQVDPAGLVGTPPPPTYEEFRRQLALPYQQALRDATPDRRGKELIDKVVHYYVALLADPTQALERQENRKRLIDTLRSNSTTPNARAYAYDQIIARCRQLYNDPDPGIRTQAPLLLIELNTSWNPDIPYVPAVDPLLETLAFPDDKYIQVKIAAVPGITRILRDSPANALPVLKRLEIADKLAAEIERLRTSRGQANAAPPVGHQWLMWQLVTALGYGDRVYNQARQPVYVDALLGVLADKGEDWLARARAAQALSRLPYEGTANLSLLNFETARLLHDFTEQYNTSLAGGQIMPMSRRVALHIYLTYSAENPAQRQLNLGLVNQVNRPGLAGHKAAVDAARVAAMPIINGLIGNTSAPRPVPAGEISNLATWLNANVPAAGAKLVPESKVKFDPPTPKGPGPAAGP
jgi:hypothetical protein